MCRYCADTAGHEISFPRRSFLKFAGGVSAGLGFSRVVFAKEAKVTPKPENVVTPDTALDRLMRGNSRYVDGVSRRHDFKHERKALTKGQNPFAGILSCADSRVAPEYAFDTGRGDLFVCRVAGNFANEDTIASFEYAVQVLDTPLIMVLGHKACGAVEATIKSIRDNITLPGHLPLLVNGIGPAAREAMKQSGSALDNAIRQNVILNVEKLRTATPIISKFIDDRKVRIVGGIYNLDSGRVDLLSL
jgi:carbonic anhydrase